MFHKKLYQKGFWLVLFSVFVSGCTYVPVSSTKKVRDGRTIYLAACASDWNYSRCPAKAESYCQNNWRLVASAVSDLYKRGSYQQAIYGVRYGTYTVRTKTREYRFTCESPKKISKT